MIDPLVSDQHSAIHLATVDFAARIRRVKSDLDRLAIDTELLTKLKPQTAVRLERVLGGLLLLRHQLSEAGIDPGQCAAFEVDPTAYLIHHMDLLAAVEARYLELRITGAKHRVKHTVAVLAGGDYSAMSPDALTIIPALLEQLGAELRGQGYVVPDDLGDDILRFLNDWLEYLTRVEAYATAMALDGNGRTLN